MLMKAVTVGGGTSGYEVQCNTTDTAVRSMTFTGKKGKKLILTMCVGWSSNMTNNHAKIDTSNMTGGSVITEHLLNGAQDGVNAYYTARCYEIDVTDNTLYIPLVTSSVTYSAVFV